MIVTEDLTKLFGEFIAVDSVSLNVRSGEVLALLGPNGAGKTTTVRMLTSILRPTRGWARVAGYDVITQSSQVRASVGVLTEQHGLYARMPGDEYLEFFGELFGLSAATRKKRVNQLMDLFDLQAVRNQRTGEYSKGMRQKLALARAMLHDPPVLLLDEPTSAMDPESARLVRDSIHNLRSEDRTIVICTHNLAEAEELADQIAIIQRGRIIVRGSPAELKRDLLGASEFEIRLAVNLNGSTPQLPPGAEITTQGSDWLRYRASNPDQINPELLKIFLNNDLPVISLHEVPRSLEQVYLQAVQSQQLSEEVDA